MSRETQDAQVALQARQAIEYAETEALRPAHSPLGASGAERWMNCAGSVALIAALKLPEDESEFAKGGTALHEAGEHCLKTGADSWELVGRAFNGITITDPMAFAVQVYLDRCRPEMERAKFYRVEYQISSPVHKDFYGKADFVALFADRLVVRDFKGGQGVFVDPEENPQCMYYAFGVIDGLERESGVPFPDEFPVDLEIVQPRLPTKEGVVRSWPTTVGALKEWVGDTLVPAMCRAEYDNDLDAGDWCRFCPAKLVCPLLTSLFKAASVADPAQVINLSDVSLGRSYRHRDAVKHYINALDKETERRLLQGRDISTAKLVKKKSNRVFKPEAIELAKAKFGNDAFTPAELKSPAELEALGPAAVEFVKEFAYQPDTGLTVALSTDRRAGVKVQKTAETFAEGLAAHVGAE